MTARDAQSRLESEASVGLLLAKKSGSRSCFQCVHFDNEPERIELTLPGLASLSSAHACVRSLDGLCILHDRIRSARFGCDDFVERSQIVSGPSMPGGRL